MKMYNTLPRDYLIAVTDICINCPELSFVAKNQNYKWGPWGLGDLGRMAIYFQGSGEQAHSLGDLGSPAKKLKKITLKEKPLFRLIF